MELSEIKVCIFDVNGVLIDSNWANAEAMGRAFSDDPIILRRIADAYLELTGIDRGSKIRILQEKIVGRPFGEREFEQRWENFKRYGRESMMNAPLAGGCQDVLTALHELGITRVALSNTPLAELKATLAFHGIDLLLDVIRGGGDWPKSESLARLLKDFEFDPDSCLFTGDGKGDLAAAKYAGVRFAAIDPGRGEFGEEGGFDGPYRDLHEWAERVLGGSPAPR